MAIKMNDMLLTSSDLIYQKQNKLSTYQHPPSKVTFYTK